MPIQPFLPIALLNSDERVFQLAKRSSVFTLGRVFLRKARTSPRSASASGGRWNGGNLSLGMGNLLSTVGFPLCFRSSHAPPTGSLQGGTPHRPSPPPPPPAGI